MALSAVEEKSKLGLQHPSSAQSLVHNGVGKHGLNLGKIHVGSLHHEGDSTDWLWHSRRTYEQANHYFTFTTTMSSLFLECRRS